MTNSQANLTLPIRSSLGPLNVLEFVEEVTEDWWYKTWWTAEKVPVPEGAPRRFSLMFLGRSRLTVELNLEMVSEVPFHSQGTLAVVGTIPEKAEAALAHFLRQVRERIYRFDKSANFDPFEAAS